MPQTDALIVGAGLSGLCCALSLIERGLSVSLIEASDAPGGRVRTDIVDGFKLDRGFQVFLNSYPEAKEILDYDALKLRPFEPGALVRIDGAFHAIADPLRMISSSFETLLSPVGTLSDKFRTALLKNETTGASIDELWSRPEQTTLQRLKDFGFSYQMIDRFFRPFFGGVFLERELDTSSRMFDFLFRMFSTGDATLPEGGMQAIPEQLAVRLPDGCLRLNQRVKSIEAGKALLESGEEIAARAIVVATDAADAQGLLSGVEPRDWASTACLYYRAPASPVSRPILVLDGEGKGPVNNLCAPGDVCPAYAPRGALVSATVIGDPGESDVELETAVRAQLKDWYGSEVEGWEVIKIYRIKRALPRQNPPALASPQRPVRLDPGLYVCGDHIDNASINGAMVSGRRAAAAVAVDL